MERPKFEEDNVSVDQMQARLAEATQPWLVCEEDGVVQGYAYASSWKSRCSYRRYVETTVYLAQAKLRKGTGSQLYSELIRILKKTDLHVAIGGIALPKEGSIALHENLGFEKVAHFKEVGWKFGRLTDVAYWQLML